MASTAEILSILIIILYISSLSTAADSPPPLSQLAGGCSDQVVVFSPCLQYISLPPNNRTSAPSSACCDEYSSAVGNGTAFCLCYLVQQPLLLGFPLDSARIFSLPSLCPLPSSGSATNFSLESSCSGSSVLPPLQATPDPGTGITRRRPPRTPPRRRPPPPPQHESPPSPDVPDVPEAPPSPDEAGAPHPTPHNKSTAEKINKNRFIFSFGLMISVLVPICALQINTCLYLHFANRVAYELTRIKGKVKE